MPNLGNDCQPPWPAVRAVLPKDLATIDQFEQWPAVADYARLFSRAPVQFVEQDEHLVRQAGGYERFIEAHQAVPTRSHNWHDFYNALSWALFPQAKQALHQSQIDFPAPDAANRRSPQQNGATLFDECGCVVVTAWPELADLLAAHRWHEVFVEHRQHLQDHCQLLTFGHALFERYGQPYIGLTGKALVFEVSADWFSQDFEKRYLEIDRWLVQQIPLMPSDLQP